MNSFLKHYLSLVEKDAVQNGDGTLSARMCPEELEAVQDLLSIGLCSGTPESFVVLPHHLSEYDVTIKRTAPDTPFLLEALQHYMNTGEEEFQCNN